MKHLDDLDDIADGDTSRREALRAALTRLADGPNELLRELAQAVLDGHASLRDAVASDAYHDELTRPFETFWTRYQAMPPNERDQLTTARP